MKESSNRTPIIVAIITVIGTVVVALITNVDKFTSKPVDSISDKPRDTSKSMPSGSSRASINIAGNWKSVDNQGGGLYFKQDGDSFRFEGWGSIPPSAAIPRAIAFQSSGSGTVVGTDITMAYTAAYEGGGKSHGNCRGVINPDRMLMTLTCTDNVMGTFVSSTLKE